MLVYDTRDSYPVNPPTGTLTPPASDTYAESVDSPWDTSLQLRLGAPAASIARRTSSFDGIVGMGNRFFRSHDGIPDKYRNTNINAFCGMSAMTQDMLTGFPESNMFFGVGDGRVLAEANPTLIYNNGFQGYAPAAFGSFGSQCPSSDIPSRMDDLYSPTATSESSAAMNFVNPTQTTLIDTFADFKSSPIGPQTPIRFGSPAAMNFVNPTQATLIDTFADFNSSPMGPQTPIKLETPSPDFSAQRSYNNSPAGTSTTGYLVSPSSYQDLRHDSISPIRQQHLRRPYFGSPQSTAALQWIQEATPTRASARRKTKREPTVPIKVENGAKVRCRHFGCDRKFQRPEHLKRHEQIHDPLAPKHKCPFCEKKFGRTDNLRSHIALHRKNNRKAARTNFHPDASRMIEFLTRKNRKGSGARSLP